MVPVAGHAARFPHLSRFVALAPEYLIYTGTPAGGGAALTGQTVTVGIEGLEPLVTCAVI